MNCPMECRSVVRSTACRVNALLVLALALAAQLFPPLGYIVDAGLVVCQDLDTSCLFCVKYCGSAAYFMESFCFKTGRRMARSLAEAAPSMSLVNICAADCDGQKSNCGQNGETSAHIIRYNESLVALAVGQIFQSALCLVCGSIDTLGSLFFAIFSLQDLLENTESDGRLRGGAGLGNHVDGEIPVSQLRRCRSFQVSAADAVACEIDLRRLADLFRIRCYRNCVSEIQWLLARPGRNRRYR